MKKAVALLVGAVLALATSGVAQSTNRNAVPPPLRSLTALIDTMHASGPVPVTPVLAESALLIDDVFANPQGSVEVTLRNEGERVITAWSIDLVTGSDSRVNAVVSQGSDMVGGLQDPYAPDEYSPLRPGHGRIVEFGLSVARGQGTSADRFGHGGHSVVDARVGAVVFDDGSVAGRDVRGVVGFVLDRYARAAALSRLLDRIRSAEQGGTLQQLVENTLTSLEQEMEQEKQALATAIVEGPGPVTLRESMRQREFVLLQQWLTSLFVFTVRTSSRSELEDLGFDAGGTLDPVEAAKAVTVRAETLRTAVEGTTPVFQSELDLTVQNLPAPLRDDIEGIVQ